MSLEGFILTRQWRDTKNGVELELWLASDDGPIALTIPAQVPLFFVQQADQNQLDKCLEDFPSVSTKPLALKTSEGQPVVAVYCQQQRELRELSQRLDSEGIRHWESDIRPPERFLMERFITSSLQIPESVSFQHKGHYQKAQTAQLKAANYQPKLRMVSLDIETSMDAKELYSIAVYTPDTSIVFMVHSQTLANASLENGGIIRWCLNAKSCLQQFLAWLADYDPDILIGWHVVQFDCWVLQKLCERWNVPFSLGRAKQKPHWRVDSRESEEVSDQIVDRKRRYIQVPGRVVLDGIELLRTAFYHFDSFSLQSVANELLGESKLIDHDDRGQAITDLFYSPDLADKIVLAQYNLQDTKLVWDIFAVTKLLDFAIARSRLTGMPLDKMGGSVASFEYAYLPRLHRKGYVAPNLGELESDVISPGGYVMNSHPGLYQHVLVLDFKSLYPSIIRTFAIDPFAFWRAEHEGLSSQQVVEGFNGAFFARDQQILPNIIRDLWAERDKAKADNDQPLSQAIKIIMNSFYGVLGSTGCRFFDPRVCSSITLRGHEIIQSSHEWIVEQGYQVIYGDTDSLFVWLGDDFAKQDDIHQKAKVIGQQLARDLNQWWKANLKSRFAIESSLEVEFETHYSDFLMPTIRGSEQGSKKRYAGTIITYDEQGQLHRDLVFKGLETVRTDWTPLAKAFQKDLYQRIFEKVPYQDYIKRLVSQVLAGACDEQLIYTKRLRRPVSGYQKSNPPHVKAARKWEAHASESLIKGDAIAYFITRNGPEPVDYRQSTIDYQHYIDKQLKPIADSILNFIGDSFDDIIEKQMSLL